MARTRLLKGVGQTIAFGVVDGSNGFFGFLDALQQNNLAKILADPTITTVSGRPARFNVGGEFPIIVPSGLGQSTIEFKPFGTQVDFVPIVLGNGNIRLEVRPRISERDDANGVDQNGFRVPALKVREVDTGVELKAGQTLALAGLVQTRVEAQRRGIPYISDVPYVGALFSDTRESVNEVELLILVTPEFADGMEPHEAPLCGPGMETVSPNNCQLYFGGHLEVPACGPCAPNGCVMNCANAYNTMPAGGGYAVTSDVGETYVPAPAVELQSPAPQSAVEQAPQEEYLPAYSDIPAPEESQAPQQYQEPQPQVQPPAVPQQSVPAQQPRHRSRVRHPRLRKSQLPIPRPSGSRRLGSSPSRLPSTAVRPRTLRTLLSQYVVPHRRRD